MMNLFNLICNFIPILVPFILIILICILYMNKFSLALCYMKCRQKSTWSTISKLTRIKPLLLGLVLIVSFFCWHSSYILLKDKLIQIICELISKVHNCLLNSHLNHLESLWKLLRSLWTLIKVPLSLLLSASVLLYLQSKKNRIKKIILEKNEKHLKDVVTLNKDLLYWLKDNLLEISETIDQMITFNGKIKSLKVKLL